MNDDLSTEQSNQLIQFDGREQEKSLARAFNEFIILKAEPTVIEEIKQLINQLDTALQRLKISVLKTDEILSEQQGSQDNAAIVLSNDGLLIKQQVVVSDIKLKVLLADLY
jgi:type II secretory pathway component GspD/PulD (secretin)